MNVKGCIYIRCISFTMSNTEYLLSQETQIAILRLAGQQIRLNRKPKVKPIDSEESDKYLKKCDLRIH